MSWLIPRDELTAEQIRAVELNPHEHRVILGAPGSGKTQILLHRARYLSDELRVQPARFRIFVFTDVLKQFIESALIDLNLPEDCVSTLDDWCIQVYKREVSARVPWDAVNHRPNFAMVRKEVHKSLKAHKPFDFVLVDEGQDLDSEAFALLKDLASHVTVAMDHKQQIYDERGGETEILRALGLRRGDVTLLDAFRCCPYIVRVASELIRDDRERSAFLNQSRTSQTEIQTPLLYEADGFEDERERLIEILRERQLVDRTIGILLPQNRQVEGFAKGLRAAKIEVETRPPRWGSARRSDQPVLNFSSQLPKVLTIHSAKGLTFDSVLLPRLVPSSFSGGLEKMVNRLLFVGMTRATKWVYMSTVTGGEFPAISIFKILARMKQPAVTVQRPKKGNSHDFGFIKDAEQEDPLDIL
jgi:superfamily I DNA/RNA helicase